MFLTNDVYEEVYCVALRLRLLQRLNGEFSIGACDNLTRTIYINETLQGALLRKVLCHEITHAAMFSYNVNLSLEQ